MAPNHERASLSTRFALARLRLLRLMLALQEQKAKTGSLPERLAELPGIAPEVLLDPFSEAEMVYRREGENYLLYSLGANGKDDGGRPAEEDMFEGAAGDLVAGKLFWAARNEKTPRRLR